jgi:3-oxoacyl-[acyl-carrier-protein] synthase II
VVVLFYFCSTPIGDRIERQAITQLFGSDHRHVLVSSTKGHTGHLLGAAGALEAVYTVLACYHGLCPSTLNYRKNEDDSEDPSLVSIIPEEQPYAWKSERRIALKNSFGFGGTNSCLVISNSF